MHLWLLLIAACGDSEHKTHSSPPDADADADADVDSDSDSDSDSDTTDLTDTWTTQLTDTVDSGWCPTDTARGPTDTAVVGSAEVGTGEVGFIPLDPLDRVEIIAGYQGLFHMLGAFEVCEMTSPYQVRYTITHEASGILIAEHNSIDHPGEASDPGCAVVYNLFGVLDFDDLYAWLGTYCCYYPPAMLHGQQVRMAVTVTDGANVVRTDEIVVRAWWP